MTDGIGVFESNIGRVMGTETRTTNTNTMSAAFAPGKIEDVAHNHTFISDVSADAIGGMNGFVVAAVEINRVGAINGDAVVINETGDGIDQAEILVLVITAKRCWKYNQRQTAALPEDQHLKLAAQIWRPPLDVTFLHKPGRLL